MRTKRHKKFFSEIKSQKRNFIFFSAVKKPDKIRMIFDIFFEMPALKQKWAVNKIRMVFEVFFKVFFAGGFVLRIHILKAGEKLYGNRMTR